MDGNLISGGRVLQRTASPHLAMFANSTLEIFDPAVGEAFVGTFLWNGAASAGRLNRQTAITGDAGGASLNGFTLGANGTPGSYANITVSSVLIYAAAHGLSFQNRVIMWLGRVWNILT